MKRQGAGTLTIISIYKPNAEAVLKILAKLLARTVEDKAAGMPENSSIGNETPGELPGGA